MRARRRALSRTRLVLARSGLTRLVLARLGLGPRASGLGPGRSRPRPEFRRRQRNCSGASCFCSARALLSTTRPKAFCLRSFPKLAAQFSLPISPSHCCTRGSFLSIGSPRISACSSRDAAQISRARARERPRARLRRRARAPARARAIAAEAGLSLRTALPLHLRQLLLRVLGEDHLPLAADEREGHRAPQG